MFDSLQPHGLKPARLLCPWNSPGKNTGVGCHFLFQGIFPTQGLSRLSYISCNGRWVLYHECHLGNPIRASCLSNVSTVLFQRMIYIWYDMIHILFASTIIYTIYFETYLQDICSRAKILCLSQASLKAVPPFDSESVDPMICEAFMVDQDVCKDLTEKAEERGWRRVTDPSLVFSSSHGGKKK